MISAAFDLALAVVCVWLARSSKTTGHDFLAIGFLWIALAAFIGGLRFAGFESLAWLHGLLATIGRGPASLLLAMGIYSVHLGKIPNARMWAIAIGVGGPIAVLILQGMAILGNLTMAMAISLLVILGIVAIRTFAKGPKGPAYWAAGAIALLLLVGFGQKLVPLPEGGMLVWVDVVHILLMSAYFCVWKTVRAGSWW